MRNPPVTSPSFASLASLLTAEPAESGVPSGSGVGASYAAGGVAETFPLAVLLADRLVVLVGGGRVAARRAAAFAGAGARIRVVAPELDPALAEILGERDEWVAREFILGDLTNAWLAHTATGDPAVDAEVAREAEWRHIFCVNAGDRDAGSAAVPARAVAETPTGRVQVAVDSRDPRRSVAVAKHVQGDLESGRAPIQSRRRHR